MNNCNAFCKVRQKSLNKKWSKLIRFLARGWTTGHLDHMNTRTLQIIWLWINSFILEKSRFYAFVPWRLWYKYKSKYILNHCQKKRFYVRWLLKDPFHTSYILFLDVIYSCNYSFTLNNSTHNIMTDIFWKDSLRIS